MELSQEAVGRVERLAYAHSNRRNRLYVGYFSRASSPLSSGRSRSKAVAGQRLGVEVRGLAIDQFRDQLAGGGGHG